MALEIIGLYAAIAGGTEEALVTFTIPQTGLILGIDWDVYFNMDGDTEFASVELSFVATNQLNVNDVRGRLSSVSAIYSLTTSGAAFHSVQKFVSPMALAVTIAERLFLHSISTSGVLGSIRCNVHYDAGAATPVRRTGR